MRFTNQPQTALVQPFSALHLSDFIGVNYSDDIKPVIDNAIILAATLAISHTGRELLPRGYVYKSAYQRGIKLPIAPIKSIDKIKVGGVETTDFETDLDARKICIKSLGGNIEIKYTAGEDTIDAGYQTAIMFLAGWLFERRAACNLGSVLNDSGAAANLAPYRLWDTL